MGGIDSSIKELQIKARVKDQSEFKKIYALLFNCTKNSVKGILTVKGAEYGLNIDSVNEVTGLTTKVAIVFQELALPAVIQNSIDNSKCEVLLYIDGPGGKLQSIIKASDKKKVAKEEVENQLERIIGSRQFSRADKAKSFLNYVVSTRLKDSSCKLKEYTIAVEALGFGKDFGSVQRNDVRIIAGRVRKKLEEYYSEKGLNDDIMITVPKGAYRAVFERKEM